MHFHSINWLSVVVAALSGFVIGSLWYGPLFQKTWMGLTGMSKEKGARASMLLTFGGAYVLNLLGAIGIAVVLGDHGSVGLGAHAGAFAAFFFIATALGVIHLFEQRPFKLWVINAGYHIVNFTAMGAIIGVWPR